MLNMIPVSSSNLSAVGYDPISNTLYVEFHSGSLYAYYDVPEFVHRELLLAPSKGRYHNRFIRGA